MFLNNLDFEVVEYSEKLVVYGGIGKVVCNWEVFDCIVVVLKELEEDEMFFIQFGKFVVVFKIYSDVLCVLLVNLNFVFVFVNWEMFYEFDKKGLMMYG